MTVRLQADLAALWHGLDALLQWQAEAAAKAAAGGYAVEVPAVQTAFLLDIGVKANLQHVTQVLFHSPHLHYSRLLASSIRPAVCIHKCCVHQPLRSRPERNVCSLKSMLYLVRQPIPEYDYTE